jgi:hypothetical protein
MGKFLKNFGLGLIYILFFPVLLVAIALMGVYGLFVCVIQFFRGAIRFFRGLEPFPPFPEDITVESVKQAQIGLSTPTPAPTPAPSQPAGPSTVYVQQNYYQNSQHPADPQQPSSPTPIDTTGFYNNPANPAPNPTLHTQTPPTLDVTSAAPTAPSIENKKPSTPAPAAYIDISKDDDGKDS